MHRLRGGRVGDALDPDMQSRKSVERDERCREIRTGRMKRIEAVLAEAGHDDFYDAAGAGDMAAVRALVSRGEASTRSTGTDAHRSLAQLKV